MEKYEKREGGREGGERRREEKVSTYLDDGIIISGVEVGRGGQKATHVLFHQKNPESVVLRRGLPDWLRKGKGGGREECQWVHMQSNSYAKPTAPPLPPFHPSLPPLHTNKAA